jgi:hypothetical protein
MKTLLNKMLVLMLSSLVLWGCKKDETMTKVGNGTGGNITASATTVVLNKATITNSVLAIYFTRPDFGYNAAVTNTLQIGRNGTNFVGAKEYVIDPGSSSKLFTGMELNSLLLSMDLPTGTSSLVNVRIKSSVSTNVEPVYTNVLNLNVTPFALTEYLYMPGAHQGWNASNPDSLISETGNGIFRGIIQFTSSLSQFKLLRNKAWGPPEFGRASGQGDTAPSTGILVGGQNLVGPVTAAPYTTDNFEVVANMNTNTIAYTPNSWGLIGSATPGGWSDDTVMKYNNTTKTWSVRVTLTNGMIKFRKNHDWAVNLGGSGGNLSQGGSDIAVTAGTYTITLNTETNKYTITP